MIRIAAVGDLHYDRHSKGRWAEAFASLNRDADLLLLAGDLTQIGTLEEIQALLHDLEFCRLPKIAVLGNHDLESNHGLEIERLMENTGVIVLEGEAYETTLQGETVGIVGSMGFGGGFVGASASEFGEPEMKTFISRTRQMAAAVETSLRSLETKYKIVLLHYSPIRETLEGEPKEIFPFLGSYLFASAVDAVGADIVFHAHAHRGIETGATPRGVPVKNVALPILRTPTRIYKLEKGSDPLGATLHKESEIFRTNT